MHCDCNKDRVMLLETFDTLASCIGLKQSGFLYNGVEEEAMEEDRLEEMKTNTKERTCFTQVFPHAHFSPVGICTMCR